MIRAPVRSQRVHESVLADGRAENRVQVIPRARWLLGMGLGLFLMLIFGFVLGRHLLGPCNEMAKERSQVQSLLTRGEYEQAIGMADLHLITPDACDGAKAQLASF